MTNNKPSEKILTDADLEELTGFKQGGKQAEALRQSGVFFFMRPDGKPRTTWENIKFPLHAIAPGLADEKPNFDVLM